MRRRDTRKIGQLGVNIVERIILTTPGARWQALDAPNDDGVDGLILFENASGHLSGQIAQVQVKHLARPTTQAGHITIPFRVEQLRRLAFGWHSAPGAIVIIWVNAEDGAAYWANLRDGTIFTAGGIKVFHTSPFDASAVEAIRELCGTLGPDNLHQRIVATRDDTGYLRPAISLKSSAHPFYQSIGRIEARAEGVGWVEFSRVGWRHITRRERPLARICQSMQLIGIAKRMVEEVAYARPVRTLADGSKYYGLTALVHFPHRDAAVIGVVLFQRPATAPTEESRTWFYSVYEKRRRRGILGEATID